MTIVNFTPWSALLGGALIGLSASAMMLLIGRITGISGIAAGILGRIDDDWWWKIAFVIGLVVSPFVWTLFSGPIPSISLTDSPVMLLLAGLLVGLGTAIGNGCTSGHGICGLSRWSLRSLVAVVTFMLTAIVVVLVRG